MCQTVGTVSSASLYNCNEIHEHIHSHIILVCFLRGCRLIKMEQTAVKTHKVSRKIGSFRFFSFFFFFLAFALEVKGNIPILS